MNQRTFLERELEIPYEDDARRLTDARYVAAALNDLRDHYACPPGHDTALAAWAWGHPAVGGVRDKSYTEKFTLYPRIKKTELPSPVVEPLENALADYVRDLLPSFAGDKRREKKHERLIGKTSYERLMIWVVQQDKTIFTQELERTWWFDFHTAPENADLADRLEFLRVCHHTNLKIVHEKPFQPDLPHGRSIFHPLNLHAHRAQFQERAHGKFLPRDEYEDEYPFDTVPWTNNPKA